MKENFEQHPTLQYADVVTDKNQAFCHLLLFFSLFEDETFKGEETYQVYSVLQAYPFTAVVDFAEEVKLFFYYKENITDERLYFKFLTDLIDSTAPNVVLFHAAEVAHSDGVYSFNDRRCLELLRIILKLNEEEGTAILQLVSDMRMLKIKGKF